MIVCFVDIGGIVDHDCLIVLFIMYKIIEETFLLLCCVILVIYIKNVVFS